MSNGAGFIGLRHARKSVDVCCKGGSALAALRKAILLATVLALGACGGGGGGAGPASPGTSPSTATGDDGYPHASEPIGGLRQIYDATLSLELTVSTFRNMDRLFPTRRIAAAGTPYPLPKAATPLDQVQFTAAGNPYDLPAYLALNRVSGLLILKDGQVVNETYQYGNTPRTRWTSMSIAKSITSTLIGAAVKDGHITRIDDPVTKYLPRLLGTSYEGVTVRQVLMMASGVRWNETYTDPGSDRRQLLELQIGEQPGTAMDFMASRPRAAAPGSVHNYNSGETYIIGEVLAAATKRQLAQYLSETIWSRFGMEADANWWLMSPNGVEYGGAGLSATLRDYARFGLFVMNDGMIGNERVLPEGWVAEAGTPKILSTGAVQNYGYLWWVAGGASRADGAFLAIGINGQHIFINRKEKVVIVVLGAQVQPSGGSLVSNTAFFDAVVAALRVPPR